VSTEAELGYSDAMHQVTRSLQRRLKALEDEGKQAEEDRQDEIRFRMLEIEHLLQVIESLHR
jgi:hypothetical protein